MNSLPFNKNKNKKQNNNIKLRKVTNKTNQKPNYSINLNNPSQKENNNQIISGYFVKEKSYKEMAVARVNTFLCSVLGFLVLVCLVSYYFVTTSEVSLNQIRKETLALNYENEDLQNKLDNLQSYYNIDKAVTRSNMLQRATKVVEISAAQIPSVKFDDTDKKHKAWSMGY